MDDNKVSLFFQALRFTPFWASIDLLLIFHLFFSWYSSWKKTGWKIDFWYFTLFFNFFVFVFLMYPFNASLFNLGVTKEYFFIFDKEIDRAFCITVIGYLFIWLGRYVYDYMKWEFPLFHVIRLLSPFSRIIEKNLRDQKTILFLFLISITTFILTFYAQSQAGLFLNSRQFFLENDALRPIFNLTLTLFQIAIIFSGIRFLQYKNKIDKYLFIIFFLFSILLGIRGVAVLCMLSFIVFRIFSKKGHFNILKLFIQCACLAFLGLYIDCLRHGQYNPIDPILQFFSQIFYGNHFSDTRDFAWILAYWDEKHVYGKTYLAGFFSFVPRFLSDFRQEWAISVYTNSLVGFKSSEHAGLRPGLFGEVFLNFGYLGVIVLGFIAGYVLRYADCMLKDAVNREKDIIKGYCKTLMFFFVSNLFITAGFWGLYVFIFLNLFFYVINKIRFSTSYV